MSDFHAQEFWFSMHNVIFLNVQNNVDRAVRGGCSHSYWKQVICCTGEVVGFLKVV